MDQIINFLAGLLIGMLLGHLQRMQNRRRKLREAMERSRAVITGNDAVITSNAVYRVADTLRKALPEGSDTRARERDQRIQARIATR